MGSAGKVSHNFAKFSPEGDGAGGSLVVVNRGRGPSINASRLQPIHQCSVHVYAHTVVDRVEDRNLCVVHDSGAKSKLSLELLVRRRTRGNQCPTILSDVGF
jgi:hypothetical protein